jgi:tagatose 1,6-diphosphate aldolase
VSDQDILPDPGKLADQVVILQLREITPAIPDKGWVPAYHFTIARAESQQPLGLLRLRVGSSDWLHMYAGHVGFSISEPHRGNRYACHALSLVAPFAWKIGIVPLWITCDPDNFASRRTCELAGAEFVDTVAIPPGNDMYERGDRFRCRYQLLPHEDAA